MDLVAGVKKVIVMMEHTNKRGEPKLIPSCTLPLTGQKCIDMLITDLCVMEMNPDRQRFVLTELAEGVSVEEVQAKTAAVFDITGDIQTIAVL